MIVIKAFKKIQNMENGEDKLETYLPVIGGTRNILNIKSYEGSIIVVMTLEWHHYKIASIATLEL